MGRARYCVTSRIPGCWHGRLYRGVLVCCAGLEREGGLRVWKEPSDRDEVKIFESFTEALPETGLH